MAIEDQNALLLTPEVRYQYLISLVVLAKGQGVTLDQISFMLEVTDSALLWASEEIIGRK